LRIAAVGIYSGGKPQKALYAKAEFLGGLFGNLPGFLGVYVVEAETGAVLDDPFLQPAIVFI
jgi:hypothetical protein